MGVEPGSRRRAGRGPAPSRPARSAQPARPLTPPVERPRWLPSVGRQRWLPLVVAAALLLHALLAVTSIRDKSGTFDELGHVFRGLAIWTAGDFRFMPENPHLAQAFATLPLLDDGLSLPRRDQEAWYRSDYWKLGDQLFHDLGNDPAAILFPARCMIVVLSVALGLVVFLGARRIFGVPGGLTALALYVLCPNVLAHARLVTTDLAASLFLLLAVLACWWTLHRVSWLSLACAGLALGGLALTKLSAGVFLPVALLLLVVRLLDERPLTLALGRRPSDVTGRGRRLALGLGALAVQGLLAWAVLWAGYGFRYEAMVDAVPGRDGFLAPQLPEAGTDIWEHQARGLPVLGSAIDVARRYRLLPEAYLYGALTALQAARGRDAFLDGERSLEGFASFFPLAFLYKVPLPTLALIALAAVALIAGRARLAFPRVAPYAVLVGVYWAIAIGSDLNIGLRHMLPVFAPTFVLCGAATSWLGARAGWRRLVVPVLLVGLAGVSLRTWPHYLASFNTFAGGPANGWRHLVDSSLDWGQDLPGLSRWLDEHRGEQRVSISYFGMADWRHAGIEAQHVPYGLRANGTGDYALRGGIWCISATRLQQVYTGQPTEWSPELEQRYQAELPVMAAFEQSPDDPAVRGELLARAGPGFKARFDAFQLLRFCRFCAHLRERGPDDQVGYSILIFRLTDAEVAAALS